MDAVWNLLIQNGVGANEMDMIKQSYLLLILIPFVSTVLAILRYIIGIKSVSIYAAIIVTFTLLEIGYRGNELNVMFGLKYTALLYVIVFIASTFTYGLIKRTRMHYVPKISLVLTSVSIAFIAFIVTTQIFDRANLVLNSTFLLIVLATLAETFTTIYARKDFKNSLEYAMRVFLISLFCFLIVSINIFQEIFFKYPYAVLILILINIYIGRFKGLRLLEYWRFRTILLSQDTAPAEAEKKQ
jgi:hypothetical protein